MKRFNFGNLVRIGVGCVAVLTSFPGMASEADVVNIELTKEQRLLLRGYAAPPPVNNDLYSLSTVNHSIVPILSFQLTAETNLMRGNSLELGANYQSWSIDPVSVQIDRTSLSGTIILQAPIQQALDFSKSIREKVELCPEKIIDKMIIDGAVGFNYNW